MMSRLRLKDTEADISRPPPTPPVLRLLHRWFNGGRPQQVEVFYQMGAFGRVGGVGPHYTSHIRAPVDVDRKEVPAALGELVIET